MLLYNAENKLFFLTFFSELKKYLCCIFSSYFCVFCAVGMVSQNDFAMVSKLFTFILEIGRSRILSDDDWPAKKHCFSVYIGNLVLQKLKNIGQTFSEKSPLEFYVFVFSETVFLIEEKQFTTSQSFNFKTWYLKTHLWNRSLFLTVSLGCIYRQ